MANIFKMKVNYGEGEMEIVGTAGLVATAESGKRQDDKTIPVKRIVVVVSDKAGDQVAWIQLSKANDAGQLVVTNEGWVSKDSANIEGFGAAPISAVFVTASDLDQVVLDSLYKNEQGIFSCCTSSGNGCYVRCCNACCSDPWSCPGASCCG